MQLCVSLVCLIWSHRHERCLASFGRVWQRYLDDSGRAFWHNRWAGTTQWLTPFDPAKFRQQDFGKEEFVQICLEVSPS